MDKLKGFINEYYKILGLKEPQKTLELSELMGKMQKAYDIPLLNNQEYNDKNKVVIRLYRAVASTRNI